MMKRLPAIGMAFVIAAFITAFAELAREAPPGMFLGQVICLLIMCALSCALVGAIYFAVTGKFPP
jgi:hypothetical protein